MKIFPYISGRGSAGQAIAKSWAILSILEPELEIQPVTWLAREEKWLRDRAQGHKSVLCIATPHAKHAKQIVDAEAQGFDAVFCEKPAGIDREQLLALSQVEIPVVAIFHGYRQMWGPQKLRELIQQGTVGEMFSIEGRYWQASAAKRALVEASLPDRNNWKNEPNLSGPHDVYLDLATHWTDLMISLVGEAPAKGSAWLSHANAETSHRDTHVQLTIEFPKVRTFGSISKNVHGAGNHLEINILGTKGALAWNFMSPDELTISKGSEREIITRKTSDLGSQQNAFHGIGWLEGYTEILRQGVYQLSGKSHGSYPTLKENVQMLEFLFSLVS